MRTRSPTPTTGSIKPGISTMSPGLFFMLIDCTESMTLPWDAHRGISKAHYAADLVNRCIAELCQASGDDTARGSGTRYLPRAFLGVYGYRERSADPKVPVLEELAKGWLDDLMKSRVPVTGPDSIQTMGWVKPEGLGGRTPTGKAFQELAAVLQAMYDSSEAFRSTFQGSMPPLLIHVTDGEENLGIGMKEGVEKWRAVRNACGEQALVFNVHISPRYQQCAEMFPIEDSALDAYGKLLFANSDPIPDSLLPAAQKAFPEVTDWTTETHMGLLVNAGPDAFVKLLQMGFDTVPDLTPGTSTERL